MKAAPTAFAIGKSEGEPRVGVGVRLQHHRQRRCHLALDPPLRARHGDRMVVHRRTNDPTGLA